MARRHRLRCERCKSFITGSHITFIHSQVSFYLSHPPLQFIHLPLPVNKVFHKHFLTIHVDAYPVRAMSRSFCFSLLIKRSLVLSFAFICCLSCSTAPVLNNLSCIPTLRCITSTFPSDFEMNCNPDSKTR